MENLKQNSFQTALDLLKQGEQLLLTAKVPEDLSEQETTKLLALTYNNLGCFYKKKNQPNIALRYLQKALDLETASKQDAMNIAGTMLNICAILSVLHKHKKAIFFAKNAILKTESAIHKMKTIVLHNKFNNKQSEDEQMEQYNQQEIYKKNIYTTRSIALYNLGVEHEFLNEYERSLEYFNEALTVIQNYLNNESPMIKVINEGIVSVENKLRQKNSLSTSQFILSSRAAANSGVGSCGNGNTSSQSSSSMSMINDMNKTSRGSFILDIIKNKTQDMAIAAAAGSNHHPYMPLQQIQEETDYSVGCGGGGISGLLQQPQPHAKFHKANLLGDQMNRSVYTNNSSYRKAASVQKSKESSSYRHNQSFDVQAVSDDISLDEGRSTYFRRGRNSGKRQPTNKTQMNQTVRMNEGDINLPDISKMHVNLDHHINGVNFGSGGGKVVEISGFNDTNSEILAYSSSKYTQLPPRVPPLKAKKRLLLEQINNNFKINSTTVQEENEQVNSRNHNPYKTSITFGGTAIDQKRNSIGKYLNQVSGRAKSTLSDHDKNHTQMIKIDNKMYATRSKLSSYKETTVHERQSRTVMSRFSKGDESSSAAYCDKTSEGSHDHRY